MIDVAIAGSLHMDIMVRAPRFPAIDETLIGSSWQTKCGGKGGNQAVAAARLGARTAMGGAIGADDFGERLRANLVSAGVDAGFVEIEPSRPSGMSAAIVDDRGDYAAVVVSGANLAIDADAIGERWAPLWQCKVLLLQNEVREAVNLAAARSARAAGARVVLNAAPARAPCAEFLDLAGILVVNRVEAAMLTGNPVDSPEAAVAALRGLRRPGRAVVLTLGRDGLLMAEHGQAPIEVRALPVQAISSHGAGDCFCGALAAELARGAGLAAAGNYANAAAGLFVSTPEERRAGLDDAAVRRRLSG